MLPPHGPSLRRKLRQAAELSTWNDNIEPSAPHGSMGFIGGEKKVDERFWRTRRLNGRVISSREKFFLGMVPALFITPRFPDGSTPEH